MNLHLLKALGGLLLTLLLFSSFALAAGPAPIKVGPRDKCPVCGMFVAKYPDFIAQIQFSDGKAFHFDGAKDMFKYYLDLARYAPGKKKSDIVAIYVTSYYDLTLIDGMTAYYVVGSDVYGPMGRELIPFAKKAEAEEFLRDHNGKTILNLSDVTAATLKPLD